MTPESKLRRKIRHAKEKLLRAQVRQFIVSSLPEILPEIPRERNVPRLTWLNLKTRAQNYGSRSTSGHRVEQVEGNAENASRTLSTEIDKILNPKEETSGKEISEVSEGD